MWILILVLMVTLTFSQELGKWRWADDTSEFTMDKEAHFVGSSGAYFFFRHKGFTEIESIKYSLYLGLGKECIDALLPWEHYGKWGGDGFSKYDLYYNMAGIGLGFIMDKLWHPKDKPKNYSIGFGGGEIIVSYDIQ
tara:strand:- start:1797 stop:2207 length:411 start_codon:yes stop_codon:yes gene_type:complete